MTNKEKYKQAFFTIHASNKFSLEVETMKKASKQQKFNTIIVSMAACVLFVGSSTIAYATDVGGIQRTIQLWMQGNQTEAVIEFDSQGTYQMDYLDSSGNSVHQGGGGVSFDAEGNERPLSEEELMEQLNNPEVIYEADGSVWVYYLDEKIDITDKFDDGICYAQVSNGEKVFYLTIKYQNGWAISPHKYASPSSFNYM